MPNKQQKLENNTIHFVAVSDNLIHQGIYESADTTHRPYGIMITCIYPHPMISLHADLAAVNEESIFVSDHATFLLILLWIPCGNR